LNFGGYSPLPAAWAFITDFDYNCLLFNVVVYNFNVIPFFSSDPIIPTYTLSYEFS